MVTYKQIDKNNNHSHSSTHPLHHMILLPPVFYTFYYSLNLVLLLLLFSVRLMFLPPGRVPNGKRPIVPIAMVSVSKSGIG